jgi:hypothetical protein
MRPAAAMAAPARTPDTVMIVIPTPEQVALARRRYFERAPVKEILAEAGIKLGTLYRCLAGDFPDGSGVEPAAIELRRRGVRVRHRLGSRAALVARIWRTAERQVEEIEDRLKAAGLELAERESNARTLAIVAKMLRELAAVDDAKNTRGKGASRGNNDDDVPRNIDDLRRALAQKLESFVAGQSGAVPGDAE